MLIYMLLLCSNQNYIETEIKKQDMIFSSEPGIEQFRNGNN